MHEDHDALLGDACELVAFRDLPLPYRMALVHYKAVDGTAWEVSGFLDEVSMDPFVPPKGRERLPEAELAALRLAHRRRWQDQVRQGMETAMPAFVEAYGDQMFGVASVPVKAAKAHVMALGDLAADWSGDWDAYHAWYAGQGDVPDHPRDGRWPAIMSSFGDEAFEDGWHRFHSYVAAGDADIPVVFHPDERHFRMKGMEMDGAAPAPGMG
jgi:hypothetical protein